MAETMHWPRVHAIIAATHPEYLWIAAHWREIEEQIQQWRVTWKELRHRQEQHEQTCQGWREEVQQHLARRAARLAALEQEVTTFEVMREQYAALEEAHATLMLEHEDLQAAYYLAQRALGRAEKGEADAI